jgi:hypothetical protein
MTEHLLPLIEGLGVPRARRHHRGRDRALALAASPQGRRQTPLRSAPLPRASPLDSRGGRAHEARADMLPPIPQHSSASGGVG